MKYTVLLLLSAFLWSNKAVGMTFKKDPNKNFHDGFSGFRPVDPISYNYPIGWYFKPNMDNPPYNPNETYWEDTCHMNRGNFGYYFTDLNNEQILNILPNQNIGIYIGSVDKTGGITYGPAAVSAKKAVYEVVMDYVKYATMVIIDTADNTIVSYIRVGVGLRVTARIESSKKGINLGDLMAIGIQAEAEKFKGNIAVGVLGVNSKETTDLLPVPSSINKNSIQQALMAIATIKAKLHDESVELIPQIVSIRPPKSDSVSSSDELVDRTVTVLNKIGSDFRNNLIITNQQMYQLAPSLFSCKNQD